METQILVKVIQRRVNKGQDLDGILRDLLRKGYNEVQLKQAMSYVNTEHISLLRQSDKLFSMKNALVVFFLIILGLVSNNINANIGLVWIAIMAVTILDALIYDLIADVDSRYWKEGSNFVQLWIALKPRHKYYAMVFLAICGFIYLHDPFAALFFAFVLVSSFFYNSFFRKISEPA